VGKCRKNQSSIEQKKAQMIEDQEGHMHDQEIEDLIILEENHHDLVMPKRSLHQENHLETKQHIQEKSLEIRNPSEKKKSLELKESFEQRNHSEIHPEARRVEKIFHLEQENHSKNNLTYTTSKKEKMFYTSFSA
jgi:hypothetical protein